jgi:hypothetical protein
VPSSHRLIVGRARPPEPAWVHLLLPYMQRSYRRCTQIKATVPRTLFCEVILADMDRDIDVYHWSSAKFSSTWHDTFSILLARGRAQVSVAASRGDWPKRTQDQAYSDQNHASAA